MGLTTTLRRLFRGTEPVLPAALAPPAIVEQVRAERRALTPAKQAAAWTDDITVHNRFVDACAAAHKLWRFTSLQHGTRPAPAQLGNIIQRKIAQGVPIEEATEAALWDVVEYEVWQASRNTDATHQRVLQPPLTPTEHTQARTISQLTAQVQTIEYQRLPKPSAEEILAAAGDNPERAAQLQAKVDEVFSEASR